MFIFNETYRADVAETWRRFLVGDELGRTRVRPEILDSWKRSMDYGVDPLRIKPANVGKTKIRTRLLENSELIRVGRSYMERLYAIVAGSGFYLMISDRDGVILDVCGDEDIIRAGRENSNLVAGADRSERHAGTNAIGTSLALSEPIQIWSDEHYIKQHKLYACSAAPIRGTGGEIIGCLNLTGFADKVHSHTLGMVISAADGISKEMEIHRAYADIALMNAQSDASIETVRSGFLRLAGKVSGFAARFTFDDIIADAPVMKQTLALAKKAARGDANILILGESGTGKELVAHAIHNESAYRNGPFVAINCGALPASLIESELFGYAPGAFTGADKNGSPGKFELADGGTIFLDEIGDMPTGVHATLLRVLQNREVVRLGANYTKKLDVRVIAATNTDLEKQIETGNFRRDLYYRLNVISLTLPPLRDRGDDIRLLALALAAAKGASRNKNGQMIDEDVMNTILSYDWPGNVRELENAIERAVNHADGGPITRAHLPEQVNRAGITRSVSGSEAPLPPMPGPAIPLPLDVKTRDQEAIRAALTVAQGNVSKASALLGISRRTLYRKLQKYGIKTTELHGAE